MINKIAIILGLSFLLFFLFRIIQAIVAHRKLMAEFANQTDRPLPGIDPDNIPTQLRHLIPLAKKWAIGDDIERNKMENDASRQDKQAFVKKIWPHMEDIDTWLNQEHTKLPISYEASVFMILAEAAAEIKGELDQEKTRQ